MNKRYEKQLISQASNDQDLLSYWLQHELHKGNKASLVWRLLRDSSKMPYTARSFDILAREILKRNIVKEK